MLYLLCVERMNSVAKIQLDHEYALPFRVNDELLIKSKTTQLKNWVVCVVA